MQLPSCGYTSSLEYHFEVIVTMKRRWQGMALVVATLILVAGVYHLTSTGWFAPWLPTDRSGVRLPSQQHYWSDLFGPDVLVTYRLEYDCGHDLFVAERDLNAELLSVSMPELERTVQAMHVEDRLDDTVLLRGRLAILCPECQSHFIIGEQAGCVAVWRGQSRETAVFLQLYPEMSVARLPESVQQQLRAGIVVSSEAELAYVLEGLDR
ncbi:MAG: hypothetical protein GX060_02610 [Firmicutes bacterium]|nr:hypothetical protein [Bacillota bacterium]